jgi:3-hydroxy acid dehydrogenase / malonic semialdehyde reductase
MNPQNKGAVFITGATAGFGEACALLYAQNQHPLILTGRRNDRLEKLAEKLRKNYHIDVETLCFDVRDFSATEKAIHSLPEVKLKSIAILINNAGLAVGKGPLDEGILDDWNRMIDTNIKGILHVSQIIIPYLKTNKKGHIVNLGSIAGKEVYPGGNVYCATKHAVDALSKGMRIDLLPYQIKVSNIAPGAAETEFSEVRFKGDTGMASKVYEGFSPLQAVDIAESIYFVTSRPEHVNINDLTIMPTAQGSSQNLYKTN